MTNKPVPEELKAKQSFILKGSINNFEQEAERAKTIIKMLNESCVILEQEQERTETIRKLYQKYSPCETDQIELKTASKLFKGFKKVVDDLERDFEYYRALIEGIKVEREDTFKLL